MKNTAIAMLLCLFVLTAVADDDKKKPTLAKPVDKSTPVLMSTDNENDDAQPQRARDYNSSRSNNESRSAAAQDYNSSRSNNDGIAAPDIDNDCDGVDDDCDGVKPSPADNHNTTRSNRTKE